jgi:hypothetical protein
VTILPVAGATIYFDDFYQMACTEPLHTRLPVKPS